MNDYAGNQVDTAPSSTGIPSMGCRWTPVVGERPEHAQFLQPAFLCACTHGVAVVDMEDQRLLPCLADLLPEASPAHQIRCNGGILMFIHVPGHDLAAPDVDYQVEVQSDPAHGCGEIGDVPTPHLLRS